jgi:hypothetical protein
MKSRQEEARSEWLFQLREVYSPLHFWSAVVLFDGPPGPNKFGVAELSAVLSKAVTLLPAREYFIFIRILEQAMGQRTTEAPKTSVLKARDFVYSRIEALNFVLFRLPSHFNLQERADPFASLRSSWRLIMTGLVPILIWLCLSALLWGFYWLIAPRPLALVMLGALAVLLVIQEILRRKQQYRELMKRIST